MKSTTMDFPDLGIRLTGSERTMNKKSRIIHDLSNSYTAFNRINQKQDEMFELLNKSATCNTSEMIEMNLLIDQLRKGVNEFEEAYSALYEASIEEEIPDECFPNRVDDLL